MLVFVVLFELLALSNGQMKNAERIKAFREAVGDEDWTPSVDFYEPLKTKQLLQVKQDLANAFRYDMDCPFLNEGEKELKREQGRCPPRTEDPFARDGAVRRLRSSVDRRLKQTKKKRFHLAQDANKHMMNVATFGTLKTPPVTLSKIEQTIIVLENHILTLYCPVDLEKLNESQVVWIVNGITLSNEYFEWRLKLDKNMFEVFPVSKDDSGIFECSFDDEFVGYAKVEVVRMPKAMWAGIKNYCLITLCFVPLFVILSIRQANLTLLKPQKIRAVDWKADYLDHKLTDNAKQAKESIAQDIYGENIEKRREFVRKKNVSLEEKIILNRRIVQTIIEGCGRELQNMEN